MKQSRSLHLRTSQLAAVAISRTVEDGSLHVELASDRRDDAGRQITLDLTPAEAVALRDALAWWLDPTSAANASHLRMGVPADDAPRPPRKQTAECAPPTGATVPKSGQARSEAQRRARVVKGWAFRALSDQEDAAIRAYLAGGAVPAGYERANREVR